MGEADSNQNKTKGQGTFCGRGYCDRFVNETERSTASMPMSAAQHSVPSAKEHILTVKEALEPMFLALEEEAEVKMIAAAIRAGWSVEEAVAAVDELRRTELLPANLQH
jgi:hypothetical protein